MSLPSLFNDLNDFQQRFISGLHRLLEDDSLGAFILVLANAKFDARLYPQLAPELERRFNERVRRLQCEPDEHYPEDDLQVFKQLMQCGLNTLEATRFALRDGWELQYNPLRAFRPPRLSNARIEHLFAPFDSKGFHFNKPFLRKEIIWQGDMLTRHTRLFYNKFPFASLHGLLVPDPEHGLPQWLREEDHRWAWTFLQQCGLPDCGLGYNARGAYSSVNHLHFQFYADKSAPYPIEQPHWQHNGGSLPYPIPCRCFDTAEAAWQAIEQLHRRGRSSYNLLYRPGRMYLLSRAMQGSYVHSPWTGGFAWSELAGAITLFDRDAFQNLQSADIEQEMRKLV